jgi:hypothetical protein
MQPHRILALADWHLDPELVADALERSRGDEDTIFTLLVPARLRGLDWVGDPYASRPCAERLVAEVVERSKRAGVAIADAVVGDPEAASAAAGALAQSPADEVLVIDGDGRRARRLARRLRRLTRLPVLTG